MWLNVSEVDATLKGNDSEANDKVQRLGTRICYGRNPSPEGARGGEM